jgi:flavorubredoxin
MVYEAAHSQTKRKQMIANKPTKEDMMVDSYKAAPDIEVLTSNFPIPGYGLVPINAFVIKGSEPILVDTGAAVHSEAFMPALRSVIDPADLKWIWLTHTDFDHIGSLHQLLAENPKLRVITTFLGVGIMGLFAPLPMDRVYLLNPGEKITVGDRTLTAIRPPAFDNPSTTGFYDDKSEVFLSSDCFGALLSAVPQNAADLSDKDLRDGQVFWATVDSPWLHKVDRNALGQELDGIRKMAPKMVLSSHLPPAPGHMTERLLASLAAAPGAQPFVGPNQAALEQMLKKMTHEPG